MRILLFGYGTVGRAVARLIEEKRELLESEGLYPKIVGVADSRGVAVDPEGLSLELLEKVKSSKGTVGFYPGSGRLDVQAVDLVRDNMVEADVLVEVTPTNIEDGEPGLTHIREALKSGVHVVTANKGPLALAMHSLLELARYRGVELLFSGTVGGGTPFIRFAERCLAGDRILGLKGVLNGTCNYILTRMEEGLTFHSALAEAQRLGYAEADPSMDVDGWDTACKLVILANHLMKLRKTLREVEVQGIRDISRRDVQKAKTRGFSVKLLGVVEDGKLKVSPVEIPERSPLSVPGSLNAVTFEVEVLGELTVIGRGAGGPETANAILKDLIEVKRRVQTRGLRLGF